MSNYLNDIDPAGEQQENECLNCGVPTDETYCSNGCKREYNQ